MDTDTPLISPEVPTLASYARLMISRCMRKDLTESRNDVIQLFTYMIITGEVCHDDKITTLGRSVLGNLGNPCSICHENKSTSLWSWYDLETQQCSLCTQCSDIIKIGASTMQTNAIVMLTAVPVLTVLPKTMPTNIITLNDDIRAHIFGYVHALIRHDVQKIRNHCSHIQLLSYAHMYPILSLGKSVLPYST